jgi:predicted metal-dependent enzyme (double-stranded beta helix superfamily)
MKKLPFKAASLVLSVLSGMLAGAVFKQVWKLIAGEEEAPEATDPRRSWKEILLAAALHGAVFAVVQAAVDRGAAQGARRLRRAPADDG